MKELLDTDKMPFGKYKGTLMMNVPASYFHWLWTNGMDEKTELDPVANYINNNLSALKKEYKDSLWN
jgi:uncharacterized protein (DUF3820 family)